MNDFAMLPCELERKFCRLGDDLQVCDGTQISGYASLFEARDQGGDLVQKGAYALSLKKLNEAGRSVKMLWQHDPALPIGVWDEVREDDKGLYVKGRILADVEKGREAIALIEAGAIDGLSIGYRTKKAQRDGDGCRRLTELELWEVSLVTFPMLTEARVSGKGETPADADLRDLAAAIREARHSLAQY